MGLQPRGAGRRIVPDGARSHRQARQAGAAQALHLAGADAKVGCKLFGGKH
jgi:hypothetical protein